MQLSVLFRLGIGEFIFGPIATLFGWLTSLLYEFFGNFGLAISFRLRYVCWLRKEEPP